ncbi:hypothetical protein ER45_028815 (plasmid) [Bacillus mycoides]|nr:hypothetical protein ER45_028815 [Bacillus mycoides]
MKKAKRNIATICTIATIGIGAMSYVPMHANAATMYASEEGSIDFEHHEDQATSYVKDSMKKQEKQMGSKANEIKRYDKATDTSVHNYLANRNKGLTGPDSKLEKKVAALDEAINRVKTEKTIKVYAPINEKGPSLSNYKKIGSTLPLVGYTLTDLALPHGDGPIFEIEIPKGTHAVYTDNLVGSKAPGLITERDGGLIITGVREVYDRGAKRTRIAAKYVSKQEMENTPKDFFGNEKEAENFAFNKVGRMNNQEENLQAIENYIHDIGQQLELDHYMNNPPKEAEQNPNFRESNYRNQ